jgi:hypothetical protein
MEATVKRFTLDPSINTPSIAEPDLSLNLVGKSITLNML